MVRADIAKARAAVDVDNVYSARADCQRDGASARGDPGCAAVAVHDIYLRGLDRIAEVHAVVDAPDHVQARAAAREAIVEAYVVGVVGLVRVVASYHLRPRTCEGRTIEHALCGLVGG